MFVTDVKCLQATRPIIPNSQTGSSKASVSEAVVRTWPRTHVSRELFDALENRMCQSI